LPTGHPSRPKLEAPGGVIHGLNMGPSVIGHFSTHFSVKWGLGLIAVIWESMSVNQYSVSSRMAVLKETLMKR
jgi:hypothetical protein